MTSVNRKVRVVIPVPGDPLTEPGITRQVQITGIEAINDLGESQVYIDDITEAGISNAYDAFVRYPSGLVQELFGNPYYRLDISENIQTGSSWQLAAVLAHALQKSGQLLQGRRRKNAREGTVVWATGSVRTFDMAVGEVSRVSEKVRFSVAGLRAAVECGAPVFVFVPQGNIDDIDPADRAELSAIGARLEPVRHVSDAFDALGLVLPDRQKPARSREAMKRTWKGNPYPGLRTFTDKERAVFFGRERAREECLQLVRLGALRGRPFLLVHGKSGAGKSSLAMAGIAGDVASHASEGGKWRIAVVRFSGQDDPISAVCAALAACMSPAECNGLTDLLTDEPNGQHGVFESRGETGKILLVLDQLEQALAFHTKGDLGAFVERLTESGHVWVVATMRTDQLGLLDRSTAWNRLTVDDRLYRLSQPTLFELSEIITRPAMLAGLSFDKDDSTLPDELAQMALRSPDSLPLLQFVLSRLADLAESGRISRKVLQDIGGFEGAISFYAETVIKSLGQAGFAEEETNRLLAELIRKDDTNDQFISSRSVLVEGLTGRRREILDRLIESRLLVTDANVGGASARLCHESLLRAWPHLNSLVRTHAADIALRDRLEAQVSDWTQNRKDENALLHGEDRIAQAEALKRNRAIVITEEVRQFIERSREEHNRKLLAKKAADDAYLAAVTEKERLALRHTRTTLVGAIAMATLTCAAAWFVYESFANNRRANEALSMTYATLAADRLSNNDAVDAIKLALAASGKASDTAASWSLIENVLSEAMSLPRTVSIIRGGHPLAMSPDSKFVATTEDKQILLWSTTTGERVATLPHEDPILMAAFSDPATLITVSANGTARVWGTEPVGQPPRSFQVSIPAREFRLSADGQRIVALRNAVREEAGGNVPAHLAQVWDIQSGEKLNTLEHRETCSPNPLCITFDPDGEFTKDESWGKNIYNTSLEIATLGESSFRNLEALRDEFRSRGEVRLLLADRDGSLLVSIGNEVMRVRPDGARDSNTLFENELSAPVLLVDSTGTYVAADHAGNIVADDLFRSRSADLSDPDKGAYPLAFKSPDRSSRAVALSHDLLVVSGSDGYRIIKLLSPKIAGLDIDNLTSRACSFLPMVEGKRDYSLSIDADTALPVSLSDICEKTLPSEPLAAG